MNPLYFKKVFSSDEIRKLSGIHKKIYKLVLVEVLHCIIFEKNNNEYFQPIYEYLQDIIDGCYSDEECLERFNLLLPIMNEKLPFKLTDEMINKFLAFGRDRFDEIELYGLSIFKESQLKEFYSDVILPGPNKIDRWVSLDINVGIGGINPVITSFNDLKVIWNYYIDVKQKLEDQFFSNQFAPDFDNYYQEKNQLDVHYTYGTLMRQLIFITISVVESYLYDSVLYIPEEELTRHELNATINKKNLQDTQIIEDIICTVEPELKKEIEPYYMSYKKLNDLRNRYVHINMRIDKTTSKFPTMLSVISLKKLGLPTIINDCIKLILLINEKFFVKRKTDLLFWYEYKDFNFESMEKII